MGIRNSLPLFLLAVVLPSCLTSAEEVSTVSRDPVVLADFSLYPKGWKARGGQEKADAIYEVVRDADDGFLRAKVGEKGVRLFKKIPWDPKSHPLVQWRWRVNQWPDEGQARIYLYVSLDRDFFGIPTITKYAWSREDAEAGIQGGGRFRPAEKVIRSGESPLGEWVTEKLNALETFREISGREPRGEAYGIGILVEPGVEADFGPIVALSE